jgi:hypothetical protein
MNLPEPPVAEMPRPPAAMKFTYASGSRPLEGYTIKRGVGRGGFGEVYFATSDAGKEVALKLIRRNLDVELRGATQCLNLKHPNLIGLYDIRTDEMGDQWIIMEYVSGESLEDQIERHPNGMPVEQVLFWMRGLAGGVGYLHDHGIVHRDLKPGNIFLDEGTVKIGDYGLAKFISCSRRSGQTESVGTVHYMAPEIANGRYGREIDTYALGVILFEMLTGNVPFEGESVGEVLMKHLTAEPDLSRLADPYRDIVRRALAKDPDVRLKSVGEMLALLPGGEAAAGTGGWRDDAVPPVVHATAAGGTSPGYSPAVPSQVPPRNPPASTSEHASMEEPIWAMLHDAFDYVQARAGVPEPARAPMGWAFLMCYVALAIFVGFDGALRIGISALLFYGVYYCVWTLVIRPKIERQRTNPTWTAANRIGAQERNAASPTAPAAAQVPSAADPVGAAATAAERYAQKARRKRLRANWRERVNQHLADKPLRDKLRELFGSMAMAACIAAVVALAAPALNFGGVAVYVWLAVVGTLGSWAVLVPAKLVEGKLEDQVPMRLTMLLLGGLVGLAAFGLGEALLVALPRLSEPIDLNQGLFSHNAFRWPRPGRNGADFTPTLSMSVTFFAFLFLVVRWWRQAEYTRSTRLSLWTVAGCMFAAWMVNLFWWFPQPAGIFVAAAIALATQLASPWMPPSQRRALAAEIEQGL